MKASILGIALLLICTPAFGDEKLLVLTEEWPPYNFSLEDEVVGLSADLEKVFLLADQGGYYLAANKDTPDSVVEKLQMALDALIKAGLRKRIQSRYLQ